MKREKLTLVAVLLSGSLLFSSCVVHLVYSTVYLLGTNLLEANL